MMRFDLLLQRHYSNVDRALRMKRYLLPIDIMWFPFSVNTEIFNPSNKERINKICFIGNYEHEIYGDRREAIRLLSRVGLLDNFGLVKSGLQSVFGWSP